MKKIITTFFLALVINNATAQTLDTLNYLRTFEQQKAQYIGQPFSVLLNAMNQVQFVSVRGGRNIRNKTQIPYCSFYFVNRPNMFTYGAIKFVIEWQTPIPLVNINYYTNRNHYYFTNEEQQFYGSKTIKDIRVFVNP